MSNIVIVMNRPESDFRSIPPTSSSLDVFLLGTVDLQSVIELQERLRREISGRTDCHGAILVCDHPPSITIGREGSFADVLVDREELIARQLEVRWVHRGGGTLLHLPGQIAVYVVVHLERLKHGLVEFRSALQSSLIATAANLNVPAEPATGIPGVTGRCGQFGFVGVAVRDWISTGGLYLNVSMPQEALELVNWSSANTRVTTLCASRCRPIAMSAARESLIRNVASSLGYDDFHLYTGHPLLQRSMRKVYVFA
jgi:lipoate-protein ligase B